MTNRLRREVPGAGMEEVIIDETTTDAFHRDAFHVIQPKTSGHRSGLDALFLAAAVPQNASGILADLGAGAGVAGLAALCLNAGLDLLAIEKNTHMAELARETLTLPKNKNLNTRSKVIEADITANAAARAKAGLEVESVAHAIMNPPYNPITLRPPKDPMKAEAFMIGEGGIDAWFRTAASIIRPGGTLSLIYRTEQLGDILACMQGRFGGLEILPLHSRRDEASKRLIIRGTRGSRAPLALLPGFVIHREDGNFTDEAENIFAGTARLSALNLS